jgi:two-component system sensor histidine kinase BaeS
VKLIHKFFLAFFITNILLVGLMFGFIYMNFSAEFNDFVQKAEQKHVANVKQKLIKHYAESASWQPIADDIRLWRSFVDPEEKPIKSEANQPHEDKQKKKQGHNTAPSLLWINHPEDLLKTGQRISLYDQQKQVVVGRSSLSENSQIDPIVWQNNIIGWVGLVPSRRVKDSPAKAFLTAQFQNYFIFTLVIILLAFVMAIVLSRHLIQPIKQILRSTNELTKGNFASRITPMTKDELGTLSNNFNELADTLEQNRQIRYQWMSDTSHELRTPLTVLRSHLLAVKDGVFVADEKRINTLIGQVDKLNHIVDDIDQLANNDTANLTYDKDSIDLIEVFELTLESYTARFEQQDLTVNSDDLKNTDPYIVSGDKERLQQLFANLLENTCRYTHEGGQVTISAHKAGNNVALVLQDSAPGVLAEDRSKLFERFYRVEKSRSRAFGGSGLGLALCKQIVEAHSGKISLADSPLGGLKVNISLPLQG